MIEDSADDEHLIDRLAAAGPRSSCYAPSARAMPAKRFEVRYISANGGIRWNRRWVNVSTVCIGEYVGLEEIEDGIWNVYEDAYGRLRH